MLLVSVRPYALTKSTSGKRCSARSRIDVCMRDPPYDEVRAGVGTRSAGSASMASTIWPSIVGTSMACVTPSSRAVVQPVLGGEAHAGTGTMRRPT